tara:strand:- start:31 stop:231 length:201 start_codon:yes stop_codon:yes gene_type:complete
MNKIEYKALINLVNDYRTKFVKLEKEMARLNHKIDEDRQVIYYYENRTRALSKELKEVYGKYIIKK